jgi:hypothetical protein
MQMLRRVYNGVQNLGDKTMSVRAKFKCFSKTPATDAPDCGSVSFQPVFTGSPENEEFFNLTPAGSISLATLNPVAFAKFEVGKEYYVDFTPA